ncbi:probable long-chain-alcohol O-fatty-acyltransferase 1 [Pyrus x bretschneideri]|uniref:probable long-chain-alcohol O-fatty-acyltransferase 1 n=1 Tax=Pyrus x bretschneideri TaxID=225117 RepID=UPI000510F810|nr:probable long-chain-alcohol O-fatty-acyltransferase 1 [Pyrus x bretschneideri]
MEGEIHNFIKVWILANVSLCYCFYIASRIPKGITRFISLLPIFYQFIILPLNLHSVILCGLTTFFLVWLGNFKLLLFSVDLGPLSPPPPTLFQFISIGCLPIQIKQNPPQESPQNTNPPQQTTQNPTRSENAVVQTVTNVPKNSLTLAIKALLFDLVIRSFEYKQHLHPYVISALYYCLMYLALEIVLALGATPARAFFRFELEPQFNKPHLSTSLQDFWSRRWNIMVTKILRPSMYYPVRRICTPILGPRSARNLAVMSTFTVSGLMHEVIYYYLTRVPPTWEVTWFFVLHGMSMVIEVEVKKAAVNRWRLHRLVSGPSTLVFLVVTANWLFFPQQLRNGIYIKAANEHAIVQDFVKSHLPLHIIGRKGS